MANLVGLVGKGLTDTHAAVAQLRTALRKDAELCPMVAEECRMASCSVNLPELELALQAMRETEQAAKTELRGWAA